LQHNCCYLTKERSEATEYILSVAGAQDSTAHTYPHPLWHRDTTAQQGQPATAQWAAAQST